VSERAKLEVISRPWMMACILEEEEEEKGQEAKETKEKRKEKESFATYHK